MEELQYYSLVSKVCTELDNHLGIADKTLAEFIIDLADKSTTAEAFAKALDENGAEMELSFSASLFSLIQKMRPNKKADDGPAEKDTRLIPKEGETSGAGRFPGLAIGNKSYTKENLLPARPASGPETMVHLLRVTTADRTLTAESSVLDRPEHQKWTGSIVAR